MLTVDRRMQEGARDLAIALNIGRVQEALYRISAAQMLDADDKSYFLQLSDLFSDAKAGKDWIESVMRGNSQPLTPNTLSYLRAYQMILPLVRDLVSPPESLTEVLDLLTHTAQRLGSGESVSIDARHRFLAVIERLASYASLQGREALDAVADIEPLGRLP